MKTFEDSICAPASSSGGAVALIRLSGPDSFRICDSIVSFRRGTAAEATGYTIKYGSIADVDDVLVSIFRAPHSYTGEDSVEIGCHASSYIVETILRLLVEAGARMAEPGEFTRRAFINGKMDLAQAEAVADVIAASSEAAHRVAMNQLKGRYSSELRDLRDQLVELAALLELELDFSEEEVEFAGRDKLRSLLDGTGAHIARLMDSFRLGNAIRKGIPVAIAGAVNSGKSTLLNALLGEDRAIVSDIPGTTRDTVEEVMVINGLQFRFIDTAGIRKASDAIEKVGIERSMQSMARAEVVLAVLDSCSSSEDAAASRDEIAAKLSPAQKLILVRNKRDLVLSLPAGFPECDIEISAKTGEGLGALKEKIALQYSSGTPGADENLVTNLRHYEALTRASGDLAAVRTGLDSGLSTDLLAEDLRSAIRELGSIFGEITTDEVLGSIFRDFCIGK